MASLNIKSGDLVEIMVGQDPKKGGKGDKGKRGRVIGINTEKHSVMVEGLNVVKKHRKPRKAQEQGGIIDVPRYIDISNVMLVCPSCKALTRVGHVIGEHGKYVRCCKQCGAVIDVKEVKQAVKKTATRKKAVKKTDAE